MSDINKKKLTLVDLAHHAKVSPMAVSHVLMGTGEGVVRVSSKTATRIRHLAEKLGYVPNKAAQQLAGKKSGAVGIIANDWMFPTEMRVLAWTQYWADRHGFRVLASQSNKLLEPIKNFVSDYSGRGIDGLLFLAYGNDVLWPHLQKIFQPFRHVVVLLGQPPLERGNFVDCDYAQGVVQAVKHLHSQGRRKIVQVLEDLDSRMNRERHRGFLEAHRELGLDVAPDQLLIDTKGWDPHNPGFGPLVDELVGRRRADAILADSDSGAIGLLKILRRKGLRAPDDVAVVGWGNENVAPWFDPSITTVNLMVREVVGTAFEMLTAMVQSKGEISGKSTVITPELILRESA